MDKIFAIILQKYSYTRNPARTGFLCGNFLADAPVVVVVVGVVPVHVKLAVVPVGVQNVAVGRARAEILPDFIRIHR